MGITYNFGAISVPHKTQPGQPVRPAIRIFNSDSSRKLMKPTSKTTNTWLIPLTVIVICAWALYLRLAELSHHELWSDELYQINQMQGTFADLVDLPAFLLPAGDFYLVYPFSQIFGYNKWGLAIPHMISTILGFYLLYLICCRYLKTIYGFIITFVIICFNTILIKYSTEIRPYAVLPTLALASLYLSLQLVELKAHLNTSKKWLMITFLIFILCFHVYGIFILFCPLLFALSTKLGDASFKIILKNTIKTMALVLAITLPLWAFKLY